MDDLISRQAAINTVRKAKDRSEAHRMLIQLPSTQPGKDIRAMCGECDAWNQYKNHPQPGCEDAVSRFEVLRLIDYSSHDLNDSVDNRYMQNEIKQLPPVTPKQPGWIPCDRELPKPNEEDGNGFYKAYLVQDGRWMDVARWDGKYWIAWGYSTVLLNVVAWMPLPKPYREGGRNA